MRSDLSRAQASLRLRKRTTSLATTSRFIADRGKPDDSACRGQSQHGTVNQCPFQSKTRYVMFYS